MVKAVTGVAEMGCRQLDLAQVGRNRCKPGRLAVEVLGKPALGVPQMGGRQLELPPLGGAKLDVPPLGR